jgi:chromosomal replication initiator protein
MTIVTHDYPIGPTPRDRMRAIVAQVAAEHGLTIDHVMSKSRLDQVVEARRDAICAIVRLFPELSYPQVGKFFGMDHSSILHYVISAGEHIPRVSGNQARTIIDWRRTQPSPDMQAAE